MREWTPMCDLQPRYVAMEAWCCKIGLPKADFYVPDCGVGPYDKSYELCRRAPWYKRMFGIAYWEFKDNPKGNSLKDMITLMIEEKREQAKAQ